MSDAIVITASSAIQANSGSLFIPHLDNYYEQWLYEKVEKVTGVSHYHLNRFIDSGYKNHLDAVEKSFDQLISSAGLYRKINKKRSSRVGVIYFDQYGPVSFFNENMQIKEMYYSDVFPSFILNAHNISGYSIRLRAERNGFFQGIELAQSLINQGELDMVIVGGVYQCIPHLFLSDIADDHAWLKSNKLLSKKSHHALTLSEASGFLLLESKKHAIDRGFADGLSIANIECRPYTEKAMSISGEMSSQMSFHYPFFQDQHGNSQTLIDTQVSENFSDSGCMNPIFRINEIIESDTQNRHCLNSIDRDGFHWTLRLNNNK